MTSVPELWGIPVAVLALIVAGAGFLISLFALGWQIIKHFFDGGRVRVYLNAATWEPNFAIRVNRSGKWKMGGDFLEIERPESLEVAQLVVENPGRTAITVYSPGLSIRGGGKRRHSISPRMFELLDMASDTATTKTVVRIEPYDRVTFLLDYWSLVPRLREEGGNRTIKLRGEVRVAGAYFAKKSARRKTWKIKPTAWTAYNDDGQIAPRTVLWRELYVESLGLAIDMPEQKAQVGYVLESAMRRFDARPDREVFQDTMQNIAEDTFNNDHLIVGTALYNGYEALDRLEVHLAPWLTRVPPRTKSTPEVAPEVEADPKVEVVPEVEEGSEK